MSQRGKITVQSFNLIVLWLSGLDNFINIDDSDTRNNIKWLMENATTAKVLPIALAENWSKVGSLVENTNIIIEHCDKTFFMDVGLPKAVNCNTNSFQIHNRLLKTKFIINYLIIYI